jgi:Fur family iron response transcriptional regulator
MLFCMNQPHDPLRKQVTAQLVHNSINPTRQRVEIGMCLFDCDKHITADQLLELVNKGRHEVSKATVYNTLGLFASKGLLREVVVDPGKQIFDTNTTPHHHVYNVDTGELHDIEPGNLVVSGLPTLDKSIEVTGVDIVVRVRNSS